MLRSLFSGITGLRAHQQMMDVTGNNIANVNSAGYKASNGCLRVSDLSGGKGTRCPRCRCCQCGCARWREWSPDRTRCQTGWRLNELRPRIFAANGSIHRFRDSRWRFLRHQQRDRKSIHAGWFLHHGCRRQVDLTRRQHRAGLHGRCRRRC